MDYDNMPAGEDMDALIAKRIFGAELHHLPSIEGGGSASSDGLEMWSYCYWCGAVMPNGYLKGECIKAANQHHYSTDIAEAWRVVEKLWNDSLLYFNLMYEESLYFTRFSNGDMSVNGDGDTAPLAICRAALKACSPKLD